MRYVSASCAAVLLVLIAGTATAQTAAATIRTTVKTGQRIIVTADTGEEVKGRVINVATDALTIREGADDVTVPYAQISRIEKQRDRLHHGMLIGLGVGAAYGVQAFHEAEPPPPCQPFSFFCPPDPSLSGYLLIWGGIGTALGAAVDALIHRRDRTIYGWAGPARVMVSPQVRGGVKALLVSMSW